MKQAMINPATGVNWFKTWFNSDYYHKLYQHRNDDEARLFIDALLEVLQPAPGCAMLDLGCGAGRHSKYLAQKGFHVKGLDLAANSISEAKKHETDRLQFAQHDMRVPFGKDRYEFVFSFFTSFGYFKDTRENEKVISNISSALKKEGVVLFDYINPTYAEAHLIPVEEIEIDGVIYRINRWADNYFIYKRIAIMDGSKMPLEYVEKVAKLGLNDFDSMFAKHYLQRVKVYGDYALDGFDTYSSKRMIIVAAKTT